MKRNRLNVIAGSAAHDETTEPRIEVLLVGVGEVWDFEIGPVAARTFAMLLTEAAEQFEARIGMAAAGVAARPPWPTHDPLAPGSAENSVGRGRDGERIPPPRDPPPDTDDPKDTGRRERRG